MTLSRTARKDSILSGKELLKCGDLTLASVTSQLFRFKRWMAWQQYLSHFSLPLLFIWHLRGFNCYKLASLENRTKINQYQDSQDLHNKVKIHTTSDFFSNSRSVTSGICFKWLRLPLRQILFPKKLLSFACNKHESLVSSVFFDKRHP